MSPLDGCVTRRQWAVGRRTTANWQLTTNLCTSSTLGMTESWSGSSARLPMKRRLLLVAMFIVLAGSTRVTTARSTKSCPCIDQTDVDDLPLVERRAAQNNGWMAVLVTGDGGWRAIDGGIADALTARGIDVVGLVAPHYFASRRTPDESACALRRIIEHYSLGWRAPNVIVCGYSRGAGVLPFMLNRMPPRWRERVRIAALIGLDRTIDFEVTPLDPLLVTRIAEPGGHHFGGSYDELVRLILGPTAALAGGLKR